MTSVLWLRRDLRVDDHPALNAAAADERMVAVFCLDDGLLGGRHRSGARTAFLLECLDDLGRSLRGRGGALVIRRGPADREIGQLVEEVGATVVHCSADAGPYARRRDLRVERALRAKGAELRTHPGLWVLDDPAALTTRKGGPYTVFSPFHRAWLEARRREPEPAPPRLPPPPSRVRRGRVPSLSALDLENEVAEPLAGGERAARRRLGRFLAGPVGEYAEERDNLGVAGTSRLSPYIHFGCLSPREIESRLPRGKGAAEFRRQLCWRDFYGQVLDHYPANARSEHQQRYRGGSLRWSRSRSRFDAWREGRTGYPLVDAGMRQLRHEGWMHNRARLMVGSFLTKDLGIDWRWGERHFMSLLLDGDEANNNGNWQWIASVGVDPQPPFRRLYNPTRQMERLDPDGRYVRSHLPELRRVPDEYLAEPWTMPREVQERSRCVIGVDYPEPVVDHAEARQEALDRYRSAR